MDYNETFKQKDDVFTKKNIKIIHIEIIIINIYRKRFDRLNGCNLAGLSL